MFGLKRRKQSINEASSELGIPESRVEELAAKLASNERFVEQFFKRLDYKIARRVLAMGLGGLLTAATPATARMIITDQQLQLDGQQFYPAAVGAYPVIVKVQETDVWAEDCYGKTIAQGEAGVDDAKVIQSAWDNLTSTKPYASK